MTYIPNKVGMASIEDSRRILRAIFPNYPELKPCHPAPILEPIAAPFGHDVRTRPRLRGKSSVGMRIARASKRGGPIWTGTTYFFAA